MATMAFAYRSVALQAISFPLTNACRSLSLRIGGTSFQETGRGRRWGRRTGLLDAVRAHRDHIAGVLLLLLGLGTAYQASQYRVGSLVAMGPGFFPLALGVLLAFIGALILIDASRAAAPVASGIGGSAPDWRGWGCIAAGILAFVLLAPNFGMFPGTFACVFVSAFGDRTATLRASLILALGISIFGVLLFSYGLHIPLAPFSWGAP